MKDYILYHSIYMKFSKKKIIVIEPRSKIERTGWRQRIHCRGSRGKFLG